MRPDLVVTECLPEELPTDPESLRNAVVLCDYPSDAVQAYARGWLIMTYDGPQIAVAGVGERFRAYNGEDFDRILAVLNELVAGRWQPTDEQS
jgi:hypothetical protein